MPGQPIVVGVDDSLESAVAARAGWLVAQVAGVGCRLAHATADVWMTLDLARTGVSLDALELAMLARVRNDIQTAIHNYVPSSLAAQMMIRPGRTATVLGDVIVETNAQLLVLGGKHHSTLGRWVGGSTVQQMARRLNVPLLVTAGALRPRPRVMVAVDGSYAAKPTVERATAFAQLLGGPLRALGVIEHAATMGEVMFNADPFDYESWSRERLERDIWPLLPIPDHHKVIRRGEPARTIAEEATAWRADVIVVGSHGKKWIDRLLIGSVTEALLNDLPAAMLVIPVPAPSRRRTAPAQLRTAVALG